MAMKNPPHPGKHVRVTCLEPAGLTVTFAARALGVSRQALNNVVNEKAGISPEMAVRLEKMGWGTAEGWHPIGSPYRLILSRTGAILVGDCVLLYYPLYYPY
jgi:addiction module HigA family antidote